MPYEMVREAKTRGGQDTLISRKRHVVNVAVNITVGEFLMAKKTFSPGDIAGLNLDFAVKQIQAGDTNTVFATGEASMTLEQRLNNLIIHLLTHGRDEFSNYTKLRW